MAIREILVVPHPVLKEVSTPVEGGVTDEVRALMARDLPPGLPIMKAVGVRELSAYLHGDASLDDALDIMRQATRNYAKRQLTWFRNQTPDWRRIAPSDNDRGWMGTATG